jgi:hypothetical protein
VLANMLMKSGINPFDSQEAKPYKNDPEILAMTNLVSAYQVSEILVIISARVKPSAHYFRERCRRNIVLSVSMC